MNEGEDKYSKERLLSAWRDALDSKLTPEEKQLAAARENLAILEKAREIRRASQTTKARLVRAIKNIVGSKKSP